MIALKHTLQAVVRIGPEREDAWLPWVGDHSFANVHRHEGSIVDASDRTYGSRALELDRSS